MGCGPTKAATAEESANEAVEPISPPSMEGNLDTLEVAALLETSQITCGTRDLDLISRIPALAIVSPKPELEGRLPPSARMTLLT